MPKKDARQEGEIQKIRRGIRIRSSGIERHKRCGGKEGE